MSAPVVARTLRSRLPSRNWSIFWSLTGTLTSLALYDKYHLKLVRQDLKSQAQVLSDEKCQTWETPRKVKVFVPPTFWARYWFKQYVRPVFDDAALDYELIEPKAPGQIVKSVREKLWTGKDEAAARKASGYKYEINPFGELAVELGKRPQYDPGVGLVAIGCNGWREVLRGVKEGTMGERPPPPPPVVEVAPETTTTTIPDTTASSSDESSTPEPPSPPKPEPPVDPTIPLSPSNIPTFPLPALGFLTCRNPAGWTGFPARIYGWFNERHTAREIGTQALTIAFGRVRPFDPEHDPALGTKDLFVDEDWPVEEQERLKEQVDIPVELAGRLSVYA
ncbi:mitochondrial import inner membrane translocase subunit Tim54 [Phlyctochytrium arcticum]|nr:mitochondrial import inner membrane translocase subunit Tim54 [Phlyctochytrium arcticum]